jgi:two-component system, NtrC family, nitrogen regulation response regulator GlnG
MLDGSSTLSPPTPLTPPPRASAASSALAAVVGRSPALEAVIARAVRMAPHPTSVLVTGESGTGKELFARLLHEHGPAPGGPFVAVNCGALSRELAESELFGHERGAFTGAATRRTGWFEEASGGTLVLDEIGELPAELQPKLLRVLETGRLRRVGGRGEIAVQVRIIALTLRDLRRDAREGRFRLDLFHRLSGFELRLPPLRSRREDIPALCAHFVAEAAAELKAPCQLMPCALARLCQHRWPGNVRELRNVIRRAAFLGDGVIEAAALELGDGPGAAGAAGMAAADAPDSHVVPFPFPAPLPHPLLASPQGQLPLALPPLGAGAGAAPLAGTDTRPDLLPLRGRSYEDLQKQIFVWALRENGGSRRRAARALGISRSTFCDRVKRLGLAAGG